MNVLNPNFDVMTCEEKLRFILCPPTPDIAKCASKFLGIMTNNMTWGRIHRIKVFISNMWQN